VTFDEYFICSSSAVAAFATNPKISTSGLSITPYLTDSLGAAEDDDEDDDEVSSPAAVAARDNATANARGAAAQLPVVVAASSVVAVAPPIPPPWQAFIDVASGDSYYFNPETNETSWSPPGSDGTRTGRVLTSDL